MGVRLSPADSEGRTPVRLAVDMNQWESAKFLADSGSDLFIAARDGKTTAEITLSKGEPGIRSLFSGGALNAKDPSGNTILHYAARQGNTATISLLLSMGAKKETRNITDERPLDIALRWNHQDAAALLN